jgi:hypothetical protein
MRQTYITEDNNVLSSMKVLQLVCDQNSSLSLEEVTDAVIK